MEKEKIFISQEQPEKKGSNKIEQGTLDIVREKSKELLAEMPEYHGWEHTELVVHYSKILAWGEGGDIFNVEMASLTHDWGRAVEKSDKGKRLHAELSGVLSKDFYRLLYAEGRINASQYRDIQGAVKHHSQRGETPRKTLKIVRDADRLSRFDPIGFYHNTQGFLVDEGLPFYADGQTIIRPAEAPVMERKDIKCVIDGLNFCLDWEKMAETDSAKKLFVKLNTTYKSFFNLFSRHSELTSGELWVAFTRKYADELRKSMEEFKNNFVWTEVPKDFNQWLEFYEKNVDPNFYSEEKFQVFLKENTKE